MPWRTAGVVLVDAAGRNLDADAAALELLGVDSVEQLRALPPDAFRPEPVEPGAAEAFQRAMLDAMFHGMLAEAALRRLDGELIRVRTAIIPESDGRFRALLYLLERPTANLVPRVYKIADVLAEWRTAERELVAVDPASEDGRKLAADVELLRDQYQQLFHRRIGAPATGG
jgi:PAS domain-containing protein